MDAGTAAVLAAAVTSGCTLVGIVWQGRKTRNKGTEEHLLARDMLQSIDSKVDQHTGQLDRLDGKVDRLDSKVERIDGRVDKLETETPT